MKIWLFLIFFLAFALRTISLSDLPHGFYEEEVTNAYVGRFILQNGRDLYGNWFPLLYFDKFGDYPPVLPLYLSGASTYIFGLNEFAARFPIALIGALSVLPLYGLALIIFKNRRASLFTAFVLAILPWHIVLSRTSAEGVIGLGVYIWGLYWIFNRRTHYAAALLLLSYFLYPGARVLVPLTLGPLIFLVKEKATKKKLITATIIAFVLTAFIAITPWGQGRLKQTSLFNDWEVAQRIQSNLTAMSYGDGIDNVRRARIFHNKVVAYTREAVSQYLSYFSPVRLFLQDTGQPRYYNVPQQGLLYIMLLPLLLFAFIPVETGVATPFIFFILYLLVVSPLPAALTADFTPHAHRSIYMIVPIVLLTGLGFLKLMKIAKKIPYAVFVSPILLVFVIEGIYFWHQYSIHERSYQSILRNDGDTEVARYVIAHKSEYDKIIMPPFERMPIYYLYFSGNFSPTLIGQFTSQLQMKHVDTIEFSSDWCPTKFLDRKTVMPKTLIVENGDCKGVEGYSLIHHIDRSDSTHAWRLLIPEVH